MDQKHSAQPASDDVTPYARAAEENKIFRMLVEGVRDYAIFLLDSTGHVSSWNVGAERIKGYRANEIVGQHFSRFYTEEEKARSWPDRELEIASEVGRFEGEGWRVRKDGSLFWANVVINSIFDENGTLRGFAKVTRDMSERRKWEEDIQRLNRELTEQVEQLAVANKQLAEKRAQNELFVYSVSHDMRAPLVNLQGFGRELRMSATQLEKLLEAAPLSDTLRMQLRTIIEGDFQESVSYIESAVMHLSTIIDSLLRLSRAGSLEYHLVDVDVGAIVHRIIQSMQHSITTHGAEVEIGPLPPVQADAAALEQLFSNLIQNALNYRDPDRRLRIEIGSLGDEAAAQRTYFVRDNGLGIASELQPKLFQAFQRFHGESQGGEGIGLTIVKKIVDRHNGEVRVDSAPGVGSTFYITLPVQPPSHNVT